jgi:hypothetical protein
MDITSSSLTEPLLTQIMTDPCEGIPEAMLGEGKIGGWYPGDEENPAKPSLPRYVSVLYLQVSSSRTAQEDSNLTPM